MSRKNSLLAYLAVCICSVLFILIGNRISQNPSTQQDFEPVETAIVVEITDQRTESLMEGITNTIVNFTAKITSGEQKGETIAMEQYIDGMFLPIPEVVAKGDKILALESQMEEEAQWVYAGVNRVPAMLKLGAVFFLLILCIGGKKGGATIASLLLTVGAIFMVYIPAILYGRNIYATTIVMTTFIILSSLLLLNGFNKKTLCAIVGNVGGTLIAGILALIVNKSLGITGVIDQDYAFLLMLEGDLAIDLQAVVWGGILIGSLGAIMDVSMSIASAMHELSMEMKRKTMPRLVYSGLQIGRDAIGTMTNTLILAYVGGSLAVVLLFAAYNKNLMVVLNLEMIVVEVIQAVVGSMGILMAVPLTVFFSAWIFVKDDPKEPSSHHRIKDLTDEKTDKS